jgi:uncharacterized protein
MGKPKIKYLLAFFALLIALAYSNFETKWPKIKHIKIKSPDLPKSFHGKKIVFVSDIHHEEISQPDRFHPWWAK